MKLRALFLIWLGFLASTFAAPVPLAPTVQSWLAAQTRLQTWSADLIQTRRLLSLTEPLTATGHVWFATPDRFRWELGRPASTIAVCTGTNLMVIYPRLKRAESLPLGGNRTGPWQSALDLLEAGFPRSATELRSRYHLLSQTVTNGTGILQLEPAAADMRRMVRRVEIDFDLQDHSLRATELEFSDGSVMRNDFFHVVLNPQLNDSTFAPPIGPDYTIVKPMGQ